MTRVSVFALLAGLKSMDANQTLATTSVRHAGLKKVFGAEELLVMGKIEFTDEE